MEARGTRGGAAHVHTAAGGRAARLCAGAAGGRAVRERAGAMAVPRPCGFEAAEQQQEEQREEVLSRQQERHYRLLAELQALVKALPR